MFIRSAPGHHLQGNPFAAGTVIGGRYEVQRKLGEGGMGAVYLARVISLGKQVALKVFLGVSDKNLRRRFEREAAMAIDMTHPGAAQVLDVGEHLEPGQRPGDGILFIAMEFIEGDDLSTLLDAQGALPFEDATAIASSVAQTLAYAHYKGVVHRDIKPQNIRVRRDVAQWQVKVLDFGIARIVDDAATRLTQEGSITGTPRYMAPEQIRNEAVDGRADVYALGIVLFEMLTGRDPFARDTVAQVLWAQMNDALPSISVVQPGRVSPGLDALLSKACAKLPSDRYATAQELLQALAALGTLDLGPAIPVARRRSASGAAGAHLQSKTQSQRRGISLPVRSAGETERNKRWIGIGLGCAAMLIASAALWVSLRGQPQDTVAATKAGANSAAGIGLGNACAMPGVSAQLAALPTEALLKRAGESRIMMPSIALKQVETLRLTADKYPESSRDCTLRQMLATSIEQESVVIATNPSLWGQTKSVDELVKLFRTMPLAKNYTLAQRNAMLEKLESLHIANLTKDHPGDGDFWRRMYIGLLVICEATADARQNLGVQLPGSGQCLTLTP